MPDSNDSDAQGHNQDDEPTVEPTVHELLVDRIDEHCRLLALELEQAAKACEQLAPERARSCRNAITMASVMVDEIRLRAHARPLDEGDTWPDVP
jgi:histidine ammonia-lyase